MKAIVVILLSIILASVCAQQTDSYLTETVTIAPGNMSMGLFQNIPRPGGAVIITEVSFQVFNAATNTTLNIEDVYNHHIDIFALTGGKNYTYIAGIGAEGERTPISFPKCYGIYLQANAPLWMAYDFINIWGLAALADMTVYVEYNITWVPVSTSMKQLSYVLLDVTGFPNGTIYYNVPNSCPQTQGIYTKQLTFTWPYPTASAIYLLGHIHIGSSVIILQDSKGNILCKADPTYDSMNFVISMGTCEPTNTQFVKGESYTLIVEYYCKGYQQVMGLLQAWIYSEESIEFDSALQRGIFEFIKPRSHHIIPTYNFPAPSLLQNLN